MRVATTSPPKSQYEKLKGMGLNCGRAIALFFDVARLHFRDGSQSWCQTNANRSPNFQARRVLRRKLTPLGKRG
jgi:hypothetical protein